MSLPQSKPICKIKPRAKKEITAAVPQSLLSLCFYKIKYFFFLSAFTTPSPLLPPTCLLPRSRREADFNRYD